MSTTKIIKGWVRPDRADLLDKYPYGLGSPLWEHDTHGNAIPATLYIGTGKLWTDEEVRAELSSKDAEIEALRNPWISVHDRLPENDDTVFVMLDYYQADMDGPDVVGLSSSGEYDTGSLVDGAVLADHFNDDDVDVTHWMPLPSQTKP